MVLPQSLLLRAENVPHYVNVRTRASVLRVYRRLHRALGRLADPLAAPHLKQLAQHSFARFKYVTAPHKVRALLLQAEARELAWAEGAAARAPKALQETLRLAFTTYKVKESPLKQLLARPPTLCDHSSLVYKLNNVPVPQYRTFAAHAELRRQGAAANSPYARLVRLLRTNNIRTGANGRKLVFEPEECNTSVLTVFGQPVAESRQANILRGLYSALLRDAPRPVHPDVLAHLEQQLRARAALRVYRRRLQHCARDLWSVDAEGHLVKLGSRLVLDLDLPEAQAQV